MHTYSFGKDKVYPLPLDKAPWSAPRGYTTSIPEEVAAYKASLPLRPKPIPKSEPKVIQVKRQSSRGRFFIRIWTSIQNHFRDLKNDIVSRQTEQNPNGDVTVPPLLAKLCCLRAEI
jgi:hypothetical protein